MYDIFICYRGESATSRELGERIYNDVSKATNYSVFFAPKCIGKGENFKTIVPTLMKDIKVVLLLLDKDTDFFGPCSGDDDVVKLELESAIDNPAILFLPLFINGFDFADADLSSIFEGEKLEEALERIKHINGIPYTGMYHFSVEKDLIPIIDRLYNGGEAINKLSERSGTRYYDAIAQSELDFLALQQNMMFEYDQDVFDRILSNKTDLTVLDIGCNNGLQTMRRFGSDARVKTVVGVDRDEACIAEAKQKYPDAIFDVVNVEGREFKTKLNSICAENGIKGFDIINVSMVILHLERPARFLTQVRSLLKPDGKIFIRDIDDGINVAYPDPDGRFAHLTEICKYCDMLGFRHSGRQIYFYLKEAGFSRVKLEKAGLDTSSMDFDEKEALFDIYFGYIPTALAKTAERHPDLLRVRHDIEWVNGNIEIAYEEFMKSSFLFSLGYMIYTAENGN